MTAKRIAIIQLTGSAIDALAAADLPAARRLSGLDLTDYFSRCRQPWDLADPQRPTRR